MGKAGEPSSGSRQMPSHFGLRRVNAVSHSAPVATQAVHAAGIGLAIKIKKEKKVVLTTIGEGSTSQGEWYEAVNWAAVHQLPVIFLVQNNQYAISVPPEMQMAVKSAADKACGLGLPGQMIDGTDVIAVYEIISELAEAARNGKGPALVEAKMYRITPHSSDDDDRTYRSREEVEENKKFDPLLLTKARLIDEGIYTEKDLEDLDKKAKQMVTDAVKTAEEAPYPAAEEAAYPVYAEEVPNA
jgi:2-oxoisovalerate dehydrogenase E1 component alpha subunit